MAQALETLSLSTAPINKHFMVSVSKSSKSAFVDGEAEFARIYIARERIPRKPASWTS